MAGRGVQMSEAVVVADNGVRRIIYSQLVLAMFVTIAFAVYTSWPDAGAACYGGGIAVLSALWMGYRIQCAGDRAKVDPAGGVLILYGGAISKFIFAGAAFAIGMGLLELPPVPVMVGFAVPQLAYLVTLFDR